MTAKAEAATTTITAGRVGTMPITTVEGGEEGDVGEEEDSKPSTVSNIASLIVVVHVCNHALANLACNFLQLHLN